ncbi:hypothetical protein HZH66_003134 [Vespula vulgaris]|uniref:Uncharacterized protein n=1 Tax=Vespula vulgaris TaxID=7454 RepID=A0A834KMG5_VESVU|nr:hypothetical protein HZH66_003134 [Vespula vulgaris]
MMIYLDVIETKLKMSTREPEPSTTLLPLLPPGEEDLSSISSEYPPRDGLGIPTPNSSTFPPPNSPSHLAQTSRTAATTEAVTTATVELQLKLHQQLSTVTAAVAFSCPWKKSIDIPSGQHDATESLSSKEAGLVAAVCCYEGEGSGSSDEVQGQGEVGVWV